MAATPGRRPWRHRSHHHARWRAPADALRGAGLVAAEHPAQPRRALRSRHRPAQARRAAGTGAERDANHRRAPGESLSADQPQHRAGCRAAGGRHGAACADRHAGAARRRRSGAADRLRQRGQSAGALGGPQPRGRHPAGHGRGPLAHRARVAGRKRHAGRAGLRAGTGAGRMDARSAGGHRAQEHSAVGSLSWRVLGFTGMLATITVFLCGMIPAWQVSGIRPNMALKSAERSTGGSAVLRWRSALMAAEVALALMLLVGGALLWKSFVRVTGVDLGFEADRVLMMLVNLPDLRYPDGARRLAFFQELEQRVERLPGVQSAGFTFRGPMRGGWGSVYETPEGPGSEPDFRGREADFEPVSLRYFETLGIPILKGRAFTPADKEGAPPVAIVNQVLARKLFPNGDAVGHRIRRSGARDWETIAGVVGEVHLQSQTEKVHPQVFFPAAQTSLYPVHVADFAIRTAGAPLAIVRDVQRQVWAIDKDQPVTRVETLEEVVSASVAQRRFQAALLLLFASVALALAVVGVYGVISYAVAQRTPEIGLRLALGAQRHNILGLTMARALGPILAGLAAGLAGALAASRLLTSLLFEGKPSDPATFALVAAMLGVVALGVCLIPARRATGVDPMVALRYE